MAAIFHAFGAKISACEDAPAEARVTAPESVRLTATGVNCGQDAREPQARCLRSKLLLWLHENRVVDWNIVFHFGEFNREVHVLNNVERECHFHTIDFTIVLIFNSLSHLPGSVPFFSAQ